MTLKELPIINDMFKGIKQPTQIHATKTNSVHAIQLYDVSQPHSKQHDTNKKQVLVQPWGSCGRQASGPMSLRSALLLYTPSPVQVQVHSILLYTPMNMAQVHSTNSTHVEQAALMHVNVTRTSASPSLSWYVSMYDVNCLQSVEFRQARAARYCTYIINTGDAAQSVKLDIALAKHNQSSIVVSQQSDKRMAKSVARKSIQLRSGNILAYIRHIDGVTYTNSLLARKTPRIVTQTLISRSKDW